MVFVTAVSLIVYMVSLQDSSLLATESPGAVSLVVKGIYGIVTRQSFGNRVSWSC